MAIDSAVVLAAGEGTRLRPLTTYRPKPMLPAANRPILQYVLDAIIDAGIDDLHIVVGYGRDRVQNHFGPTYRDRPITYHHQESQLGTGHALLAAADAVGDETLLVNGDELVATSMITDVCEGHTDDAVATIAVSEHASIEQYGAVTLDNSTVTEIIEDPETDAYRFFNAGVYVVTPQLLPFIKESDMTAGELRLTDALNVAAGERNGAVHGVRTRGLLSNVTYPWDLLSLTENLSIDGLLPGPERDSAIHIADTAQIHDTVTLRPPVVIGPDVSVHAGAILGPHAAIGRGATIAAGAVVAESVVDDGVRIGPQAAITDSIIGPDATIGAGVTLPAGPGDVRIGTTVYEDAPLGSVIGDRTNVGGGTTVAPGTLIGTNCTISSGMTIDKNISAESTVQR